MTTQTWAALVFLLPAVFAGMATNRPRHDLDAITASTGPLLMLCGTIGGLASATFLVMAHGWFYGLIAWALGGNAYILITLPIQRYLPGLLTLSAFAAFVFGLLLIVAAIA